MIFTQWKLVRHVDSRESSYGLEAFTTHKFSIRLIVELMCKGHHHLGLIATFQREFQSF
jgi:hypothetical protein